MVIRITDWRLIAISIAIGSIITIVYDVSQQCLVGLFDSESRSLTCSPHASAQIFAMLIAFLVGFVYLKIFQRSYKSNSSGNEPRN